MWSFLCARGQPAKYSSGLTRRGGAPSDPTRSVSTASRAARFNISLSLSLLSFFLLSIFYVQDLPLIAARGTIPDVSRVEGWLIKTTEKINFFAFISSNAFDGGNLTPPCINPTFLNANSLWQFIDDSFRVHGEEIGLTRCLGKYVRGPTGYMKLPGSCSDWAEARKRLQLLVNRKFSLVHPVNLNGILVRSDDIRETRFTFCQISGKFDKSFFFRILGAQFDLLTCGDLSQLVNSAIWQRLTHEYINNLTYNLVLRSTIYSNRNRPRIDILCDAYFGKLRSRYTIIIFLSYISLSITLNKLSIGLCNR